MKHAKDDIADQRRDETLKEIFATPKVRAKVLARAQRISIACEKLTKQSRPLTISNITVATRELFTDDEIGASTIWNKTSSAAIYRRVVDAWKVWLISKDKLKSTAPKVGINTEIPDSMISRIEPPEARLMVLLVREALRNTRNQLNAMQSLTSERLIRPTATRQSTGPSERTRALSREALATIRSVLDTEEMRLRGFQWGETGELIAINADSRSSAGVQDALLEVLNLFDKNKFSD
jgi:hypothetical protein